MSDWLNAELFTAVVICYLINAVPSALFGIAQARRTFRPWWHGALPAFFLPWIGLAFLSGPRRGEPYLTGPARYSMIMLFIAGLTVLISIWLPWLSGDGQLIGEPGSFEYSPNELLLMAVLVWLLALCLLLGGIALMLGGGFVAALVSAIVVSVLSGLLAAMVYLFGPAGVFLSEARMEGAQTELDITIGPGALIALVALVAAYLAVLVMPAGLHTREPEPAQVPPPAPESGWGAPTAQPWGQVSTQQWGEQQPRRPQGPGATW